MKLISEYGSVEELFRHTTELKGKLKEIIENNKEQIEFSKKLATIELNVPVELDEKNLSPKSRIRESLKRFSMSLNSKL